MPPSRIPAQDPSMSPTYSMSTNQPQAPIASSIRRNLFAGHLSRRPVAPTSQNSFGPSSPTHQNTQSQPDLYSGPTLQPTKRTMSFQDIYDPNISPSNHPISPSTSSTMFPRESIIAVHPITGKPLLPNLPTLPPKLRLSEGDEEDVDSDSEVNQAQQQQNPYQHHTFSHSPSYHNNLNLSPDMGFDPDMDSSELERIGIQSHDPHSHLGLDTVMDSSAEESHRDRERIERLLADMQARQRARARTINPFPPPESKATSISSSSTRSRRQAAAAGTTRERSNPDFNHPPSSPSKFNATELATVGGVGVTMDASEKDELMGLIMTSLRRKLQTAEEEGWMYSGADGVGGMGLESDAVGIYD